MKPAQHFWTLIVFALSLAMPGILRADDAFGHNIDVRDGLSNSDFLFNRFGNARVAFIGGSITEMNGYRPMVCDLLTKRFPATKFTFTDAGISSTCSTTGTFRLEHDVFQGPRVDLLFVEFAVNDDQDAHHTREECIRGMEGIIRHARAINPDIDIVVTFFVNEGMLDTLQHGKTPLTIEAHQAVADRYGVPMINLAREVAEEITAGKLTWKQYGGVHPAPFGNAIAARMIDSLFDRAKGAVGLEPRFIVEPIDALSYSKGRFLDPKAAELVKGWTLGVPDWDKLPGDKRDRFTKIPMLTATEPGAELTLKFDGTAVGAYVVAGPDAGVLEASVDGSPVEKVNLLHAFSAGLHYPRTVMFASDLKRGSHTLTLRVSTDSHGAGHAARIMQFVAN